MARRHFVMGSAIRTRGALLQPLARLTDQAVGPAEYGAAMRELGAGLGRLMASTLELGGRSVLVAATVEDMDNLGAGLIEEIARADADVRVACLWIKRSTVRYPIGFNADGNEDSFVREDVAQVIQEYIDDLPGKVDHFIALKSIISSSCVIRTSILRMLSDTAPANIHVTSPVMLRGAKRRLEETFPREIADRFRYWVLAVDSQTDDFGNVQPGVGGNVYERLGFRDEEDKNFHLPEFVVERIRRRREPSPAP